MRRLQFKFPSQIRISGWDFGSSARAMNQAGGKDSLMTYESVSKAQAEVRTVRISTTERKKMSSKTTFKRIALVAVAALGLGVVTTVAPASAANRAISALTVGTLPPVRTAVASTLPVTASFATTSGTTDTITVTAKVISAPTGSVTMNQTTAITSGANLSLDVVSTTLSAGTESDAGYLNASGKYDMQATEPMVVNTTATSSATFAVTFKPDVAGTYQILVSGNNTSYTSGDPSTVITVTTAGTPASMTITKYGQVVKGASKGAVLKVSLKDASGAATVLGANEAIDVTTSNSTTTSLSVATLGSPSSSGSYTVTVTPGTITADGSAVITFTGSGLVPSTVTSNTTVSVINAATGITGTPLALTSATGYALNTSYYTASKSSHGFTYTAGTTALTADTEYAIDVDATGTGAVDYSTYVTVANGAKSADFSIAQALSSTGVTQVAVQAINGNTITIIREAAVANKISIVGASSITSATGASNVFTAEVDDQYGNGLANQAVSVSVSGRNTVASTTLGVTDANGLISYTLKDAGTTGTSDSVVFSATLTTPSGSNVTATTGGTVTGTITYGTFTVGTVTVTGGSSAETVAGSTLTAINAADNGPEASSVAITATVKDANGNLLAGVPVTFAVSAGLIKKTASVDYSTVYTGSNGKATSYVFNWVPGTQTITATAGGKSGTDYLTWAATDASSARVLSATAAGNVVSVKVVDRFGNGVKGVTVSLSRSGTGFFGNGTSTASVTTDKYGSADIQFNGTATVTAELSTATYAQSADIAGQIAATAVTAASTTTTKGTGASLAPAGVSKVTVDVADTSMDAIDAANEATDAANAATDAANAAAEAADAATAAAQDAQAAVAALATQVASLIAGIKAQITTLTNLVVKIQKKVKA